MNFSADVTSRADAVILRVRGELDMVTAPLLETAVTSLPAWADRRVIVDLNEVSFCDVRGCREIATAYELLIRAGARVTVIAPPPVQRLITALYGSRLPLAQPEILLTRRHLPILRRVSPPRLVRLTNADHLARAVALREEATVRVAALTLKAKVTRERLALMHEQLADLHMGFAAANRSLGACSGESHRERAAHFRELCGESS